MPIRATPNRNGLGFSVYDLYSQDDETELVRLNAGQSRNIHVTQFSGEVQVLLYSEEGGDPVPISFDGIDTFTDNFSVNYTAGGACSISVKLTLQSGNYARVVISSARNVVGQKDPDLSAGLTNFWPLDEVSGDRLNTERDLPLVEQDGTVTAVEGLRGAGTLAAYFERDTVQYLFVDQTPEIFTGGPWTINFWVKIIEEPPLGPDGYADIFRMYIDAMGNSRISSEMTNDPGGDLAIFTTFVNDPEQIFSREPSVGDIDWSEYVGIWKMFTLGYDGTNAFTHFDGGPRIDCGVQTQLFPSQVTTFSLGAIESSLGIYQPTMAVQFFGKWNRALSESEIVALYNGGRGLTRSEM